jgi:hypothetical protein
MSKPLTKKEWRESVAEMWSEAVKSTYQDLIDEAVKAEREACAKIADEHINGTPEWNSSANNIAEAIRARGQA